MSLAIGVILALGVGGIATLSGLDRDRALYAAVMGWVATCPPYASAEACHVC